MLRKKSYTSIASVSTLQKIVAMQGNRIKELEKKNEKMKSVYERNIQATTRIQAFKWFIKVLMK